MSRESLIARGRAFQEKSFTEQIEAGTWTESVDPETLETITTFAGGYAGPALVKYPDLSVDERTAVGQQYSSTDLIVKVPVAEAIIPEGTIILVTASTSDASLVGRKYRVKAAPQSGNVTSHRYPVVEE
ncbi:MAG: hypothetical protein JWP85_2131 [Rhodoglobus sp.]|nr:hypothetical protein [Rhodoglobus sp.]